MEAILISRCAHWTRDGPESGQQSGNTLLQKLNDAIPNTGSGTVDIPIELTSESAGKLSIESFEITYTMQTTNLDLMVPKAKFSTSASRHTKSFQGTSSAKRPARWSALSSR